MSFNSKTQSKPNRAITQNMSRVLYETGYNEAHVIAAIKSKGFSDFEAIQISYDSTQEIHDEIKKHVLKSIVICILITIPCLLIGINYDFGDFKKVKKVIPSDAKIKFMESQGYVLEKSTEPPLIKSYRKNHYCFGISIVAFIYLLARSAQYFFKELPKFKSITKPI